MFYSRIKAGSAKAQKYCADLQSIQEDTSSWNNTLVLILGADGSIRSQAARA
jgi:hypothetical protein